MLPRRMRGKIFSRSEADRMIPLIRRIVVGARARHRLLQRKQEEIVTFAARNQDEVAREALLRATRRLRDELKGCTRELEDLGCFLRDADAGIVECYGGLDGEIVYFTWQPGQDGFLTWHPLDQSWVNRQPLPGVRLPHARETAE